MMSIVSLQLYIKLIGLFIESNVVFEPILLHIQSPMSQNNLRVFLCYDFIEASEETCMIPAYLQDNHNFEELELLFTNFDTVCKDTTRKLEEAKHRLDNEANRLEQRLTPRWDDRNAIKARIGKILTVLALSSLRY